MCQGRTVRLPRLTRQRKPAGVTGRPSQGGGTGTGGIWCASAITSTAPKIHRPEARPLRERTIFVTCGGVVSDQGQRRPAGAGPVGLRSALGEMKMQPRSLDVAEQLVLSDR